MLELVTYSVFGILQLIIEYMDCGEKKSKKSVANDPAFDKWQQKLPPFLYNSFTCLL